MSQTANTPMRDAERLQAYHDGELGGIARWLFERRLRREPGLRAGLSALTRLGELVRQSEVGAAAEPDLWDGIAGRLRVADAQRAEEARQDPPFWAPWLRPAGAVAAAAGLAVAVWFGVGDASVERPGGVRWVDTGGRPVLVLDERGESDVTVIWLLDEGTEGAVRGGRSEVV